MIDLHIHLDGCLTPELIWKHARIQDIDLGVSTVEELREKVVCPPNCKSLNEYLEKYDLPLAVLQTKECLQEATEELVKELNRQGLVYVEIRFAPQLHLRKGLTQEDAVQAVLAGIQNATTAQRIQAQAILCCMRGDKNTEANRETVELTAKYWGKGVCACDLAGAEALYPTAGFEDLFAYAKSLGVPYTIHAGEADGADSVKLALDFGAKRIGHGVHSIENPALMERLLREQICLENCPTSNLQTKAEPSIEAHPIKKFLEYGLKVTINTDALTVSDTTIAKEVALVREHLGLTAEEELRLYLNAAEAAFLPMEEKEALVKKVRDAFALRDRA